jgi:predicted phosphoadenosine phosphosulfate sulfurtransferase
LTAAQQRISTVFDHFETVVVSYSGGKDSTVLLELARQEARRRGRQIYAVFIDLEAQYRMTIQQIEDTMLGDDTIIPIWICLPLNLRNAVSVFQPHWGCWDADEKENWVRPMPDYDCVVQDGGAFPFFRPRMEFEEFIVTYPRYIVEATGTTYASLVAIRSDESLNRYRAVAKKDGGKKSAWALAGQEVRWATVDSDPRIVSFYPIYDWRTEDVWRFIGGEGIPYNQVYDTMYWAGVTLSEQRICQPYGDDQRRGLDLWAQMEPETWPLVLNRVVGVNYGTHYAGAKFLGYRRGVGVPDGHNWKSYTFFLLSTLPDVMRERYLSNFAVFLEWWMRHGYENLDFVHDDETVSLKESERKRLPSWRRLALAILKNDFLCKSLSIGAVKDVYGDVYERVADGQPVKVRKSVKPVYAYLRGQYEQYLAGGIAAVNVDFNLPEHHLMERYKNV